MTYPKDWTATRDAAQTWTPPEDISHEYANAVAQPSAAPFCVGVFDLLKAREDLDRDGLGVALACAHLINKNTWFGKTEEALNFIVARAADHAAPAP